MTAEHIGSLAAGITNRLADRAGYARPFPGTGDCGTMKQQSVMKLRITALLPIASVEVDAVTDGAKTNRELVIAMAKLGYRDVEARVTVGQANLKDAEAAE